MWGNNTYGQLGQNEKTQRSSPVQVPGTTWDSISISYRYAFGTKTDGTAWSWGFNGYDGNLAQNDHNIHRSSPTQIPGTDWLDINGGLSTGLGRKKSDG